jgi:hypothetical protein
MPALKNPVREALRRAAGYVASALRHDSPSARIAATWTIRARGDAVFVRTGDIAAEMTARNKRHPLFAHGPRGTDGWRHWYSENQRNPARTDWDLRAVDRAYETALINFADAWLDRVAIESKQFERTR